VAAAWLTWASLRHDFDLRRWSVLGPLLAAGIPVGYGWLWVPKRGTAG